MGIVNGNIIIPSKNIYDKKHELSPNNKISKISIEENVVGLEIKDTLEEQTIIEDLSSSLMYNSTSDQQEFIENTKSDLFKNPYGYNVVITLHKRTIVLNRYKEKAYIHSINPKVRTTFDIDLSQLWVPYYPNGVSTKPYKYDFAYSHTLQQQKQEVSLTSDTYSTELRPNEKYTYVEDAQMTPAINISLSEKLNLYLFQDKQPKYVQYTDTDTQFDPPTQQQYHKSFDLYGEISTKVTEDAFEYTFYYPDSIELCCANNIIHTPTPNKIYSTPLNGYKLTLSAKSVTVNWNETTKILSEIPNSITLTNNTNWASINLSKNMFSNTTSKNNSVLNTLYKKTLNGNVYGKECLTLKCSISDYFDTNGTKVISPSDRKHFTFDIGNKVIPYYMNAQKIDVPISKNSDGLPKVFSVVGVKIIYDGAVWQELSLRESAVELYKDGLIAPTISITEDVLHIVDNSGGAVGFDIYVNDVKHSTIYQQQTYDLKYLALQSGDYVISVKAFTNTDIYSGFSNSVTYQERLLSPTISIIDGILSIVDNSGIANKFLIYVDNVFKATTTDYIFDIFTIDINKATCVVTVVALAQGYKQSLPSNEIIYNQSLTDRIKYEVSSDLNYATCVGRGTAKGNNILISDYYLERPVTKIARSAFARDNYLERIKFGENVTEVLDYAFLDCKNLSHAYLNNKLKSIGSNAFDSSGIINIEIPNGTIVNSFAFANCPNLESLTIPEGNAGIGSIAPNCPSLKYINIPSSVTFTNGTSFSNCPSILSINVDSGNTLFTSIDGNLYKKENGQIKEFVKYASGKTDIIFTMDERVTYICDNSFDYSFNLDRIVLGSKVEEIGTEAFKGCTHLKRITIPDSVTEISDFLDRAYTFAWCENLSEVIIGKNVTSIPRTMFYRCYNLKHLKYNGTVSEWSSVKKRAGWNTDIPATYVQCLDGNVEI